MSWDKRSDLKIGGILWVFSHHWNRKINLILYYPVVSICASYPEQTVTNVYHLADINVYNITYSWENTLKNEKTYYFKLREKLIFFLGGRRFLVKGSCMCKASWIDWQIETGGQSSFIILCHAADTLWYIVGKNLEMKNEHVFQTIFSSPGSHAKINSIKSKQQKGFNCLEVSFLL